MPFGDGSSSTSLFGIVSVLVLVAANGFVPTAIGTGCSARYAPVGTSSCLSDEAALTSRWEWS
jgi:hypothetical protein